MGEGFQSLGRVRLQGIALLVGAFILGGVAGVVVDRVRLRSVFEHRVGEFRERREHPEELPGFFTDLGLSSDQEAQVRRIMSDSRPRMDSLMAVTMPRMRAMRDSVQAAISAVLTPEQREIFEKLQPRRGMGPWGRPFGPGDPGDSAGPDRWERRGPR
jgi:Spy/CpxP family protein refolding chaperone